MAEKSITVFTDGACTNNGYHNAKAGIGVHFPNGELRDLSRVIKKNPTNQRAELYAILVALYYIDKKIGLKKVKVIIKTDSEYSINCLTKWSAAWKKNGWVKKDGEKVKNKEILTRIDDYLQKYDVSFEHVRSHTGNTDPDSIGNDAADKLATAIIGSKPTASTKAGPKKKLVKAVKKTYPKKRGVVDYDYDDVEIATV